MKGLEDRIRHQAKEARDAAARIADPLIKARLHEIANTLEKLADELERQFDTDPRA